LVMEAASTSETSVKFCQTARRNIPEDSLLHIRCHENLKSHLIKPYVVKCVSQSFFVAHNRLNATHNITQYVFG
jgi:hypothetical protein